MTARVAALDTKTDNGFWFPYLDASRSGRNGPISMPWRALAPGSSIQLEKLSRGKISVGSEVANESRLEIRVVDWLGRNATVYSESFDAYALPDIGEAPNHMLDPK